MATRKLRISNHLDDRVHLIKVHNQEPMDLKQMVKLLLGDILKCMLAILVACLWPFRMTYRGIRSWMRTLMIATTTTIDTKIGLLETLMFRTWSLILAATIQIKLSWAKPSNWLPWTTTSSMRWNFQCKPTKATWGAATILCPKILVFLEVGINLRRTRLLKKWRYSKMPKCTTTRSSKVMRSPRRNSRSRQNKDRQNSTRSSRCNN